MCGVSKALLEIFEMGAKFPHEGKSSVSLGAWFRLVGLDSSRAPSSITVLFGCTAVATSTRAGAYGEQALNPEKRKKNCTSLVTPRL